MVSRKRLNVTLYLHCLSCSFELKLVSKFTNQLTLAKMVMRFIAWGCRSPLNKQTSKFTPLDVTNSQIMSNKYWQEYTGYVHFILSLHGSCWGSFISQKPYIRQKLLSSVSSLHFNLTYFIEKCRRAQSSQCMQASVP